MKATELLMILEKKLEVEQQKMDNMTPRERAKLESYEMANIEYLEKAIVVIKVELDLI